MSSINELSVTLPDLTDDLNELDKQIREREYAHEDLKPDNEARIVWFNDDKEVTEYSLVYIHGFTASQGEGYPTHVEFGKRYGCNVYLCRLFGHGLGDDALDDITPQRFIDSAVHALAVGKKIGKKVILMGTSTGASLAIFLASRFKKINGVITYSPLIDFYDRRVKLLGNSGVNFTLTKLLNIKYVYAHINTSDKEKQYWYNHYRIEGLKALKQLILLTMNFDTYRNITQPFFLGYYYLDQRNQDRRVSVPAMLKMYKDLGTNDELKRKINFQQSKAHVIASSITSKDYYNVMDETFNFAEDILKLQPVMTTVNL
ncbi:MAG TPA: alpha/beta hydrolase [Balneolales bacterium]|nr:alpha/beta hydrolase [Balneolales bacterium]